MMFAVGFGSHHCGDYRVASDKDLLLVGADWHRLSLESARRQKQGFSVSAFRTDKANYMVRSGSLFFKHIADDGLLLAGSKQDYRSLISKWAPARSYSDEIEENLDLLEIVKFVPQSNQGMAAVTDIVISSVRNVLIRRLADQGCYKFSWQAIFAAAHEWGLIKEADIGVFMVARHFKNLYRQGVHVHPTMNFIGSLAGGASRALRIALEPQFTRRSKIRSLPEKLQDGSYKQLRALELLCAEYGFTKPRDPFVPLIRRPAYFHAKGFAGF